MKWYQSSRFKNALVIALLVLIIFLGIEAYYWLHSSI